MVNLSTKILAVGSGSLGDSVFLIDKWFLCGSMEVLSRAVTETGGLRTKESQSTYHNHFIVRGNIALSSPQLALFGR